MKKVLVLCLVLGMVSAGWAATVTVKVADNDVKESYVASDTIIIELVGGGFVEDGPEGSLGQIYVPTTGGITQSGTVMGTASNPFIHPNLEYVNPHPVGDIVNAGGVLISGEISGGCEFGNQIPNGTAFYWFEYHVPDVEYSTIITIDVDGLQINDIFGGGVSFTTTPLDLHVAPEPATMALLGLGGLLLRRKK